MNRLASHLLPTCNPGTRRASVSPTAILLGICLMSWAWSACSRPDAHTSEREKTDASALRTRPGDDESADTGDPSTWLRRGQALEAEKRPVEALMAYRHAMRMLPDDWPADKRDALKSKIARLSFLMGVPGQVERQETTKRPVVTMDSAAVTEARKQFALGRQLEQAGKKTEAMAAYQKILDTIEDQDDSELYWNAWQRLEDLAPEGQGPSAQATQEKPTTTMGTGASSGRDDDGADLLSSRTFGATEAGIRLLKARKAYVAGMTAVDGEEREAAREAFETVIKLIDKDQDPELYRAAEVNLRRLRDLGRHPTPNPFLGY